MGARPKLTYEEHYARAMLMGRQFWLTSHVYVQTFDGLDFGKEADMPGRFIDATTLEPVDRDQRRHRYNSNYGEGLCDPPKEKTL